MSSAGARLVDQSVIGLPCARSSRYSGASRKQELSPTVDKWVAFRRLADLPSAQALVELLLALEVPARIEAPYLLPGIDGYYIVAVPSVLLHRAGWVSPKARFDEAELAYLATGQLNAD